MKYLGCIYIFLKKGHWKLGRQQWMGGYSCEEKQMTSLDSVLGVY